MSSFGGADQSERQEQPDYPERHATTVRLFDTSHTVPRGDLLCSGELSSGAVRLPFTINQAYPGGIEIHFGKRAALYITVSEDEHFLATNECDDEDPRDFVGFSLYAQDPFECDYSWYRRERQAEIGTARTWNSETSTVS